MRNYTLLFSFILLFVVSDLDAQRSRRSSKRTDKSTEIKKSTEKDSDELHKSYGFESREEMIAFLLDKDLNRSDRKFVDKVAQRYAKGKKLTNGQNRRLKKLLEKYNAGEEEALSSGRRSGRMSGASTGRATSRAKGRSGRSSSTSRAPSRGRSGRQEAQDDQGPPPFEEVDENNDGEISREEARAFFGDDPNFDAEYDNIDSDNSGSVDPQEYADADDGDRDDEGGPPFEEVDTNGDGEISREEARSFFGDEPDFDAEYDNVDTDNSGSVNMDEWEAADGGDGEHDWYCQICDMHFDSGEAMDDHAAQMGHTNADFDCDPNGDYPQMDPGPDGGCADYADCNGNGVFDVGEPCYEGDDGQ